MEIRELVNVVDEEEHSNNFCRVIKDTWGHALSWRDTMPFRFAISGRFVQLLSSIRLIENNTSEFIVCLVKAHNTRSLSNLTRHRAWPFLDEDLFWMKTFFGRRLLGWLKVVHSAFPKIFFAQCINIIVNDPFFIPYYLLQKWCLLIAFIERVANGNAIHQIFR